MPPSHMVMTAEAGDSLYTGQLEPMPSLSEVTVLSVPKKHVKFSSCKLFKMKMVARMISGHITIPTPPPHAPPPLHGVGAASQASYAKDPKLKIRS
jgi:hypothetical protein